VRFRSIVHCLSLGLYGQSIPLPDFPIRKGLLGLGMSDWEGYALPLAEKLGYTNAFYHQEPFFDITRPPDDWTDRYDFVVSSDVMEHVAPPIQDAFDNLFRILRPGGFLVLSVPFVNGQPTREHFPDLHRYEMLEEGQEWVLRNKTKDGTDNTYRNLTFHGGPGTTVEMRVFGQADLLQNLAEAGFTEIEVMEAPESSYGILWNLHDPSDDPYDKPILGLDAPPIIAHKPH
jgi:SAM-dependent methyltransferase